MRGGLANAINTVLFSAYYLTRSLQSPDHAAARIAATLITITTRMRGSILFIPGPSECTLCPSPRRGSAVPPERSAADTDRSCARLPVWMCSPGGRVPRSPSDASSWPPARGRSRCPRCATDHAASDCPRTDSPNTTHRSLRMITRIVGLFAARFTTRVAPPGE
jgi:hypothetical protein